MKTLNEHFEDKEFLEMKSFKNGLGWREFILLMFLHCKEAQVKGDFEIYGKKKNK
jgi:hypothetical protein